MICNAAHSASLAGQVARDFAMHVEHEAADRHRRKPAIVDQLVPVGIAQLGRVLAEGLHQVLRVLRRQPAPTQHVAQLDAFRLVVVLAEEARLERIETRELFVGGKPRVVGDVVGGAHEIVEGKDRRPVPAADQPRGDREILVAVALAGSQFGACRHCRLGASTWTRPFHWPPRRRAC